MFYISRVDGNLIGVTDTEDNVEDILPVEQVMEYIARGVSIEGYIWGRFYSLPKHMIGVSNGEPCVLDGYRQVLYLGYKFLPTVKDIVFYFYDDCGIDGCVEISSTSICAGERRIEKGVIDTKRVEVLTRRFNDSGNFIL